MSSSEQPLMINLEEVVSGTADFPAMPKSASRLAALFANQDWEIEEITETVKLDPVLTGRVLRAANSVAAGSACQIASVDSAAMRIGPGAILAMALGAAAKDQLNVALPCYGLTPGQLWRRSVSAALAIECSQRHGCGVPPPEAFAAALLRDIGILVLADQMSADVLELLERSRQEGGCSLTDSEMEILGVHHGEVGGLIARHWGLPAVIADAIAFHHAPDEAPTEEGRRSAWFVALADAVSHTLEQAEEDRDEVPSALLMRMGMTLTQYLEFVQDVESRLDEVLARYE